MKLRANLRIITVPLLASRAFPRGGCGLRKDENSTMTVRKPPPRFTTRLEVLVPEVLPRAIELAAERSLMSMSEYARQALIAKLRADGIDLLAMTNAA